MPIQRPEAPYPVLPDDKELGIAPGSIVVLDTMSDPAGNGVLQFTFASTEIQDMWQHHVTLTRHYIEEVKGYCAKRKSPKVPKLMHHRQDCSGMVGTIRDLISHYGSNKVPLDLRKSMSEAQSRCDWPLTYALNSPYEYVFEEGQSDTFYRPDVWVANP